MNLGPDNLLLAFPIITSKLLQFLLDCFNPHQVFFSHLVFIIKKSPKKGGLFIFWCHSIQMGIIQSAEIHLGFLSGLRVVWKLVSVDPWPRPAESQCVSFYGNGEIVTTSQQRPAACRLLNRAHLQKTEGPCEMGSDPSSPTLTYMVIYRHWISLNLFFTVLTS